MPHFSITLHCLQKYFKKILDYLFPKDALLQEVESMSEQQWQALLQHTDSKQNNVHVISLFSYDNPLVQRLIHALKYEKNNLAYTICAKLLSQYISSKNSITSTSSKIALCPIPQSKKRKHERGYNQCELLAKKIHKTFPNMIYIPHLLLKTKHTKSQTTKNKQERLNNLANTISINKKYASQLAESTIIIIDDVYTTGATASEAIRALQSIPYKTLYFITIAKA